MKITSVLISGAGNTFHIISDDRIQNESEIIKKSIIKNVCLRNPADGVIFLKNGSVNNLFEWDFFNNDGSAAEMCGNATRCVGFYLKNEMRDLRDTWLLQTKAGSIKIKALTENNFQITMTSLVLLQSTHGFFCNTGVPHLVLPTTQIGKYENLRVQAQALRMHTDFLPAGTNVTFIHLSADQKKMKAVSYERGVEDFTQACGTGAVAAAFYNLKMNSVLETTVEMPGGSLIINLTDQKNPLMTGPAVLIGKYNYEFKI